MGVTGDESHEEVKHDWKEFNLRMQAHDRPFTWFIMSGITTSIARSTSL